MEDGSATEPSTVMAQSKAELREVAAHVKTNSIEHGRVTIQEAEYIDWEAMVLRSWVKRGIA